ncbi:RNase H family protein [Streptomyces sp. NPDC003660]
MSKALKRQMRKHGRIKDSPQVARLIVATDGSCDQARAASGYVSNAGHYGLRGHGYPDDLAEQHRVVVTELRAMHYALERILSGSNARKPIRVLCDSQEALQLVKEWRSGSDRMPEGYRPWRFSGNKPTLYQLHDIITHTPTLSFRHQRGHVGHPLNEAADSLAKLALRFSKGGLERAAVEELAPRWAERAVSDFSTYAS